MYTSWDAGMLVFFFPPFSPLFFLGKTSLANQGETKDLPPCCSFFNWPEEKEVPVMYGSCSFWFQSRATAGLAVGELVNTCESSASCKSSNHWPAQEQIENCCGLCHCEIVDIKEFQARFHSWSLSFNLYLKNMRRVRKNMRRVCQSPLICDQCVGCHLLETYCRPCFIHFYPLLDSSKIIFPPPKIRKLITR